MFASVGRQALLVASVDSWVLFAFHDEDVSRLPLLSETLKFEPSDGEKFEVELLSIKKLNS